MVSPTPTIRHCGRHAAGFALAEGLIAATILAVAVVAIAGPLTASYSQSGNLQQTRQAVSLANQLLEEIVAKPFVDPTDGSVGLGGGSDESGRADFDNVGDYDGYHDTTATMTARDGTAVDWPDSAVLKRSVKIEYRGSPDGTRTDGREFALVSVTVTMPDGRAMKLSRLAARVDRAI